MGFTKGLMRKEKGLLSKGLHLFSFGLPSIYSIGQYRDCKPDYVQKATGSPGTGLDIGRYGSGYRKYKVED